MNEVLDFWLSAVGIIALIVGAGSIVFYPKQTLETCHCGFKAIDKIVKRWAAT